MDELISVIIPVYNAEKFIEKSIDSVMRQTYTNFEVWLIEDGSLDNTPVLCDQLSEKYANLNVVHKENGGPSSARNKGIDVAKGKYITFIDADDYVDGTYLMTLYNDMQENDADLVVSGYKKEIQYGKFVPFTEGRNLLLNTEEALQHMFVRNEWIGPCTKLFKSSYIKDSHLQFNTKLKKGEDMLFVCQYIQLCKRIFYDPKTLYYYVFNQNSICRSTRSTKVYSTADISNLEAHKIIDDIIKNHSADIKKAFACRYVCTYMRILVNLYYSEIDNKELSGMAVTGIRKRLFIYLKHPVFSLKEKCGAVLMAINPKIFFFLYRILNSTLGIEIT